MINEKRLIGLAQKLIKTESETGNEYNAAMIIKREMEDMGLAVKTYEFAKKRPNVIGVLKSKEKKKTLLITTHIDVVPAGRGWKYSPYSAKICNGKIYGRGSTDCKGNIAACLEAVRSLIEEKIKLEGDLIVACAVDEEKGSKFGLKPLIERKIIMSSNALVLDASNFDIIVAQKGLIHLKVRIFGKKAHGAYPQKGINAIEIASDIICDIKKHRFKYKKHPLLNKPTINIGTIKGGDKVNIVADYCEFEIDLRYLPKTNSEHLLKEIRKIIEKRTKKYKIEIEDMQRPYEIDKDNIMVKVLLNSAKKLGLKQEIRGSSGATPITFFQDKSAIATGFGSKNKAHTTNEYVKIKDLINGAKLIEEFVKEYMRYSK